MYFENFPLIRYSLEGGNTSFVITDFFRRVKADAQSILGATALDEYDIREGETPEIVAHKLYDDANLHWVILIMNEIIDPRFDWPLTQTALNTFIKEKYGLANIGAVHHYVNADGDQVHSSYAGTKTAITNTEYEETVNESKRRIKIVKRQFVPQFIQSFTGLLTNGD